jgi:hypothetical protein
VPFAFGRDSPCPCGQLVMVRAALPETPADGHTPAGLTDGRDDQVSRNKMRENQSRPTCPVFEGAQAGEQGARSGDLRKCIAKRSQECCPR